MLFLKHGGHILEQTDQKAVELDRRREGITLAKRVSRRLARFLEREETTSFDYLFAHLAKDANAQLPAEDPKGTVAALKALGAAMVEQTPPPPTENSTV